MVPVADRYVLNRAVRAIVVRGSARFTVGLRRSTATFGQWVFGTLTWADQPRHRVPASQPVMLGQQIEAAAV